MKKSGKWILYWAEQYNALFYLKIFTKNIYNKFKYLNLLGYYH